MASFPFDSYDEAKAFFGVPVPRSFFDHLTTIGTFCKANGLDTPDTLFDLFGLLRIENKSARYQQTPIELFPFASTGSDGIHYGFVIHTTDEDDYPSAEMCPMDSEGVMMIGNDTHNLFQNLLTDEETIDAYLPLLKKLGLDPVAGENNRYDEDGNGLKISVKDRTGWKFLSTGDGTGVFAKEAFFDTDHERNYDLTNRKKTIEKFESLADEMRRKGLYASQLYYLKELYWNEWVDYELARKYLKQMLVPYEKLDRQHLYETARWSLDTFNERFSIK